MAPGIDPFPRRLYADQLDPGRARIRLAGLLSEGDVNGPKPGFFDFVGTAKYEAWEKLAGTPPEDAMRRYVDLVRKLRG